MSELLIGVDNSTSILLFSGSSFKIYYVAVAYGVREHRNLSIKGYWGLKFLRSMIHVAAILFSYISFCLFLVR